MNEATGPAGLPPPKSGAAAAQETIDKNRICNKCGQEGRVVSNQLGVNVFCNTCKRWWPITTTPMRPLVLPVPLRGLSKETMIEPDWNKAFDDD